MPRERSPAGRLSLNAAMSIPAVIDTAWQPLVTGCPPAWASEWGQDSYGVFIAFTLGEVTQRLRWIPPGRFLMGSPEEKTRGFARFDVRKDWIQREHPCHTVFLSQGFWLFETPCTQALWAVVMGSNPSRFQSPDRPVEQVSWLDAQDFMRRLNERIPGLNLVLPTEAQWERACRAGTDTAIYSGSMEIRGFYNAPALDPIAWHGGNSGQEFDLDHAHDSAAWPDILYYHIGAGTRPVALKAPNPWGLYDMLGNIWEWCADCPRVYTFEDAIDPMGHQNASDARVIRGASWYDFAVHCRSSVRGRVDRNVRSSLLGFRCARGQA